MSERTDGDANDYDPHEVVTRRTLLQLLATNGLTTMLRDEDLVESLDQVMRAVAAELIHVSLRQLDDAERLEAVGVLHRVGR